MDTADEMMNNLVATGALFAVLSATETVAEVNVETVNNDATNHLIVLFDFLKSPYRITIERIADDS